MPQQCQRSSVQVYSELSVEAAPALVSGNWPVLETLIATFTYVNEQVVNKIVTGNWPMLKELHIQAKFDGVRRQLDSWQTIEQECYNVCKNRWPGLKVELFRRA